MHAVPEFPFLRETLLFLALAGVMIPLLQRLRINQILGFLAVGALLGPGGLGQWVATTPSLAWFTFQRGDGVQALAELGVLFLMFLIGLELSAARMWALRGWVFGAGTAQVLITAAVIGLVIAQVEVAPATAIVVGALLALSSTAVVMQVLGERRLLPTRQGQAAFAVLMLQDLAVVPLLLLVDVLSDRAGGSAGTLFAMVALKSAIAVGVIFVLGRRLIGPVFRTFARQHQPEVFVALTLLTTLSIAGITAAAGLSMALGAFLAGLLLAETEYRHEVEVTIEPFKGLLMGLFFMSVGMTIDFGEVVRHPFALAAAITGLVLVKGLIAAAIFRAGGMPPGPALEAGLLLGQGGEFAFVVIGAASGAAILSPELGRFLVLVVSGSLFLTPLVASAGAALRDRLEARRHAKNETEAGSDALAADLAGHVIVAGCGRVGQLLADVFARQGVPFVAIEQDAHVVARLRRQGVPVVFGNASRPELLRKLHAERASAVLVTMDQAGPAMHAVRAIRADYPALPVLARSRDERHARDLRDAGATLVVPETLEAALQLAGATLARLGLPDGVVAAAVDAERSRRVGTAPPSTER